MSTNFGSSNRFLGSGCGAASFIDIRRIALRISCVESTNNKHTRRAELSDPNSGPAKAPCLFELKARSLKAQDATKWSPGFDDFKESAACRVARAAAVPINSPNYDLCKS